MSLAVSRDTVAELSSLAQRWRELAKARNIKGSGIYTMSQIMDHESRNPPSPEEVAAQSRIAEIGRQLHAKGGEALMLDTIYAVEEKFGVSDMTRIERAWDGIGGWAA